MPPVEPWKWAAARRSEFDAGALAYDRYRPRYPEGLFDALTASLGAGVGAGAVAVDIGAGTGIASEPLARRGVRVIAIEPAPSMAAIAQAKLGALGGEVAVSTFEDWEPSIQSVDLVCGFNSWHWVDPAVGVDKVASLLSSGGSFALVWTEVQQFGEEPFDTLSGLSAYRVPHADAIEPLLRPIDSRPAFGGRTVTRFRFERVLDADTFIAETRTYPGPHSEERDRMFRTLIEERFAGSITKVEDAVLYLYERQ